MLSSERRPLIFLAAAGAFTIIMSDFIVDEVKRKMMEIGWGREKSEILMNALIDLAEMVDYRQIEGGNYDKWLNDPDDHPIMATALAGKANYLVTWNTKDFPPKKKFAEVMLITPDAFLREFG